MNNDYYDEELHVDFRDLHALKEIGPAIDILIDKIKSTDDCDDHLSAVSSFYDFAYRKGFEAGKKEAEEKKPEQPKNNHGIERITFGSR